VTKGRLGTTTFRKKVLEDRERERIFHNHLPFAKTPLFCCKPREKIKNA